MKQTLNSAIGGLYLSLRAKPVGIFLGGYIGGNIASGIWERLYFEHHKHNFTVHDFITNLQVKNSAFYTISAR